MVHDREDQVEETLSPHGKLYLVDFLLTLEHFLIIKLIKLLLLSLNVYRSSTWELILMVLILMIFNSIVQHFLAAE